jgi:hypothetical protein
MQNPLDYIRRIQSRLGKPLRPVIELQSGASIVSITTTSVQDGNIISDVYKQEGWEVPPKAKSRPLWIDGIYKGQCFFVTEEGAILDVLKEVEAETPEWIDSFGVIHKSKKIIVSFKGTIGSLLDAELLKRGSALKPSMMQTMIYCFLVGGFAFMAGMSYG